MQVRPTIPKSNLAGFTLQQIWDCETSPSIFLTLISNLEIFDGTDVARMTGGNDMDFKKPIDPDKPRVIFMVVPDNKKTRYPLVSLFVSRCYAQLLEYSHQYPRKTLPQRVRYILDELGNMPAIPDFAAKITSELGHNVHPIS